MDLWQRARSFAEEAAKRSQEITKEAAKRSQVITKGAAEIVSETAKKSREIATEATKRADLIKVEALKRADQIKTLAEGISSVQPLPTKDPAPDPQQPDLEKFGVTDELREFVKEITMSTFQDFPLEDEPQASDVPTVSNVRQDLTEWQARHAMLVLSTVKEISRLRYELCPRHMKERKFWRIYFMLVKSHVTPYEKRYMEEIELKSAEQGKDTKASENTTTKASSAIEMTETNRQSKASATEQDLDVFLLGDLGSSDDGPDDGDADGDFDDDFDKIVSTSALESEDDDENSKKQSKTTTDSV